MRSFHLLFVLMSLVVVKPAQAADFDVMSETFFTVTLPYDLTDSPALAATKNKATATDRVAVLAQEGMTILLMRLTGRKQLLESSVGQNYITHAKNWLASYYIKPRIEEGVAVGQNIELRFDSIRLKKAFSQHHIKLWASNQRPKTLVMGTFVQNGRLEKLEQEILNYRIDVDFRAYPSLVALPISVPDERKDWVFPVEPSNNLSAIQEVLLRTNQQNLLSFKLLAKRNGTYDLNWYLFSITGSVVAQQQRSGADRQALMKNMFDSVMQTYVKSSAIKNLRKNHLYLNINQVAFSDQINTLEEALKSQQPMIRDVQLTALEAGKVQFDIEYQGDYQTLLNWLTSWTMVEFVNAAANQHSVDVNVHYQSFQPQLQYKAQPASQPAIQKVY